MDHEWEDKRWKKSWENLATMDVEVPMPMWMMETQGARRPDDGEVDRKGAKRVKMETNGVVWGEEVRVKDSQVYGIRTVVA